MKTLKEDKSNKLWKEYMKAVKTKKFALGTFGIWCYEKRADEIIRLIEDEIDSFHKIHIHTAYPSGQTKCSEPKECYLDKRLNKLKRNILTKIKGARK